MENKIETQFKKTEKKRKEKKRKVYAEPFEMLLRKLCIFIRWVREIKLEIVYGIVR